MKCLPGISHLLQSIKLKGKKEEEEEEEEEEDKGEEEEIVVPLPDDILIDVLSRLPARAILRCRAVCRRWRSLTSSVHFVTLQAQRAPCVVLVQGWNSRRHQKKSPFYIYDEISNELRRIPFKVGTTYYGELRLPFLYGAFGPLLHLKGSTLRPSTKFLLDRDTCERDLVVNLITRKEQFVPKLLDGDKNNGVLLLGSLYFHKPTYEYKCICKRYLRHDKCYQYYSYSLASRTLKEIAYRSRFTTSETSNNYPVAFKNALHLTSYFCTGTASTTSDHSCWHTVLVFDMDSEKFHTLPHPEFDSPCLDQLSYNDFMRLFVHDGHLALCHVHDLTRGLFDIWMLEDYEHWHWIRKASLGKDELLLDWFSRYLLVANLKELTTKEIRVPLKRNAKLLLSSRI
ncbi:unnamed protein product [Cuscuta campestris]|uniref:F-box domain-containing protein n=1 Tax=Cuscuta campestris TaxID=132261 RepID=A0A484KPU7_9ASTE|nr:unnamed protein product [Cuscuta campestris]